MHKKHTLIISAAVLLLVGAGCAPKQPPAPEANGGAPTQTSGSSDSGTPEPRPVGDTEGLISPNNAPAPEGSGLKNYNSAPYDFQYPEAYILTNEQMTDAFRKPYLSQGLDAPLQQVNLTTSERPAGKEGEGPATIRVIQWNNSQRLPLADWAKKHGSYTGYPGMGLVTDTFMGYASVAYEYDGQYGGHARLIDLDGTVLQVSSDLDANGGDPNKAAYEKILATLKIAPVGTR